MSNDQLPIPVNPNYPMSSLNQLDLLNLQVETSKKELDLMAADSLTKSIAALKSINYVTSSLETSLETLTSCVGHEYQVEWAERMHIEIETARSEHGIRTYYLA